MLRPSRLTSLLPAIALLSTAASCAGDDRPGLPAQLTDTEFWHLVTTLSEAPGVFAHSHNLVSNEPLYVENVRMLRLRGGVYVGVGPEQNFSYIARIEPAMAFIIDIRQENRNLHLLYKALFEASATRGAFIARLFSRELPARTDQDAGVRDLFTAIAQAAPSARLRDATARLVRERLVDAHKFPLAADDLAGIDDALNAFYSEGPELHYGWSLPPSAAGPSYRVLMNAADIYGEHRSFLASDDAFAYVKAMHEKNLIVPLVGDFSGAHAIRRVGDYIRQRGALVSAFYGSNVEVYLTRAQTVAFCHNLVTLPFDARAWYIRSKGLQEMALKFESCAQEKP